MRGGTAHWKAELRGGLLLPERRERVEVEIVMWPPVAAELPPPRSLQFLNIPPKRLSYCKQNLNLLDAAQAILK